MVKMEKQLKSAKMEVLEKRCELLEGNKVLCLDRDDEIARDLDGNRVFGKIAGFDPHIGLTICDANNKKNNMVCFTGPDSTIGMELPIGMDRYYEIVEEMCDILEDGVYQFGSLTMLIKGDSSHNGFTEVSCAFSA